MIRKRLILEAIDKYESGKGSIEDIFTEYLKYSRVYIRSKRTYSDKMNDCKFMVRVKINRLADLEIFVNNMFDFREDNPFMYLNWKSDVMDKMLFVVKGDKLMKRIHESFKFKYNTCPLNVMIQ